MKATIARLTMFFLSLIFICLIFTGKSFAKIDPKSIVGIRLFDDGSGTTAKDSSGNKNDGKLMNGPKWVEGKFGKALEFDGVDDYVLVPKSANLPHGSSARTVEMWIYTRPSSWQVDANTPFHYGAAGTTRGTFSLDMDNYPNMQLYTWADDLLFDAGVPKEGWVHVVLIYDGDKTIKAYTQGKLRGAHPLGGVLDTGSADIEIGSFKDRGFCFDGLIDEVGIFKEVLTEDDIKSIMTEGLGKALGITAVSPSGKLTTTWGSIKAQ